MTYNWEEIFKSKSDSELYEIFIGKSYLNSEAVDFAKAELLKRSFDFENIEKYQKKRELKRLIDEEQYERKRAKPLNLNSEYYLFLGITGLFSAILIIIGFYYYKSIDFSIQDFVFSLIVSISACLTGFIVYKRKKKREKYRKTKIEQLKDDLNE